MALDFGLPRPVYAQLRVDIYSFPLKSCVRDESVSDLLSDTKAVASFMVLVLNTFTFFGL